jgi:general bacterial porin, GBP family
MKKTFVAIAALGLNAGAAHAQSSVTLYGLIDTGITYVSNSGGSSLWKESVGAVNNNRWGLIGSEDLGGGLKAIFTLENGFNANNGSLGQGGLEFGRQAFVGLTHSTYGTVELGRQYSDVGQILGPLSLTGTASGGTNFAHPFDNDNFNNSFRVNNAIRYQSPNIGGFTFGTMYAFSNSTAFSNNRLYDVAASYAYGGLTVAAGYMQLNNGFDFPLSIPANNADVTANINGAVTAAPFAATSQRVWGAGLNYTFGAAMAGFVFSQTQLINVMDNTVGLKMTGVNPTLPIGSDMRFNNFEVNGIYSLTPALKFSASYTYTAGRINGEAPGWHSFDLLADYYLSKRTDVYIQGIFQHVNAAGIPGLGAEVPTFSPSSSPNQAVITAGLRTRF